MQINSFIKFGSLAFDVASDTKVRELFGMVHHGARRRGLLGVPQGIQQGKQTQHSGPQSIPSHWPKAQQPIPFSPAQQVKVAQSAPTLPKPQSKSPAGGESGSAGVGIDLKKWANMDSAKKVLGWADSFNQLLSK